MSTPASQCRSGHWKLTKLTAGRIRCTWRGPILAGGRLVLVNTLGQIVFASPTDGSVLQTVETRTPISLSPIVAGNTLYILDDRGRLTAYR